MLLKFGLLGSLIALTFFSAMARAQWTPSAFPTPPPGPRVQLYGNAILDSGRVLSFGPNVYTTAIDPSGNNVYGYSFQPGIEGTNLIRWDATGVHSIAVPSLSTGVTSAGVYYATDTTGYGTLGNGSSSRAFQVTGDVVIDVTPGFATDSFFSAFEGNRAAGAVTNTNSVGGPITQAYVWDGTTTTNLHEASGFGADQSTAAYGLSGSKTVGYLGAGNLFDGSSTAPHSALLWNGTTATNLHTTGGVEALGYTSSEARNIVGDYIFGVGSNDATGASSSLVWAKGQAQELSSFLNVAGAQLGTVDALGNLTVYSGSGESLFFSYLPNAGNSITQGYAGSYYGSGFGGTAQLVYENNFESNANGFSSNNISTTQIGSGIDGDGNTTTPPTTKALGRFSNEPVSLMLDKLVPGETYSVTASLFIGGTWDGGPSNGASDIFTVSADGDIIYSQSYLFQRGFDASRIVGLGSNLSGNYDYAREFSNALQFVAKSGTASLVFQAPNSEPVTNEWWALDNVQVTRKSGSGNNIPEPGTLAFVLVAGVGVIFRRRR